MQDINQHLEELGIEPLQEVDRCPERKYYKKLIQNPNWEDKKYSKQLKAAEAQYALAFHHYFAKVFEHMLYESGDDKTYWLYDVTDGVYRELSGVGAVALVLKLLEAEGLREKATESVAKTVLARYRANYVERGKLYDDFDSDDNYFHANNGWVHLTTLEFTPHTPTQLSRIKSAVDYNAESVCQMYDKFLDEDLHLKDDQIRVIDQFSGLTLVNDIKYQKMLTLLGRPGCGKSTLLDAWMNVLGEKGMEKKLTELQGESMRFAGSQFIGSTLCWFDEVDVKKAEMGNSLGTLITGQHINVERKGINGIVKARNTVKCVLTANRLPMAAELGIYRRLIMIPIQVSFVENGTEMLDMPEKLAAEASGILNRMIKGLQDLRKMGRFTLIEGHEELIEEYKAQSDTMAEFLDTYFEPTNDDLIIETTVLFRAYQHFSEGNSFTKSITPQKFGRLLATQPLDRFAKIVPDRTKHVRGWKGLKLKSDYRFDDSTSAIVTLVSTYF
jgi:P4 family phage/plasmid primase-like protien